MRKERAMVAVAALLASFSIASAQKPPIPNESLSAPTATQSTRPDRPSATTRPEANTRAPDASGAPVPETTGQGPNFEDRWSGQPAIQYLPPAAAISNVTTPAIETTGYAPTVSKKMGPEMESAGDVRAAPDSE
jgi:hypothetical protein